MTERKRKPDGREKRTEQETRELRRIVQRAVEDDRVTSARTEWSGSFNGKDEFKRYLVLLEGSADRLEAFERDWS